MNKYEQAKNNIITAVEIDCDTNNYYNKSLEEIKKSAIQREIQVIDFFNVMERKIKECKSKPELSMLRAGYEIALNVFINGK
tara:strand:+ start:104 stop:349 length:246 start_codon:yes stop_codon:yes gene_type:complete